MLNYLTPVHSIITMHGGVLLCSKEVLVKLSNGFYVLCGIPGVGKSTFVNEVATDALVVSSDKIRETINGEEGDQSNAQLVWAEVFRQIKELCPLTNDNVVILDSTMARPKDRKHIVKYINECGVAEVNLIYLNKPLEVARTQNANRSRVVPDDVLERMSQNLKINPPSLDEGFARIIEVK